MRKKIFSILILIMCISKSFSQIELNSYKYVIVPNSYNFLKGVEDKYQLNSLTKFLFEKYGFAAMFEDADYPDDLLGNPCLAVTADINNQSKMFMTKLIVELKDCHNKVVFTSLEGKSKEKEYKKTYQEALRNAFVSIEVLDYKYDANTTSSVQTSTQNKSVSESDVDTNKEIESVSNEVITEGNNKIIEPIIVPVVVANEEITKEKSNETFVAKSYKNKNISFFLIQQNNNLVAYVNESKDGAYKKGELIGTLYKTSRPKTYRITWKNQKGETKETTGYFDETGNLNIDVDRDGKIEVIIFKVEKS